MAEAKDSCVEPAKGPILPSTSEPTQTKPIREEGIKMMAQVGKAAPDFEASAFVNGGFKNIKLSEYKGKWVVLCFYPGDFTFVWPTELSAVAAKYEEIKSLGVEVLSVSTDSRFTHKIWQEEELSKMVPGGVPFPMLSDAGGRIGKVYGVYDEEAGVDIRGRFLIDPDGIIQAMEVLTPPVGRNVSELIRQIKAFQYVRATGEVTPSGWQPGKPTLKPGPDLAGKVWKIWKPEMAFWIWNGKKIWEKRMAKKEKLLIIGGSAAGPSAAARAKRVNPDLEITMFEQGRFISYGSWETPYYIGDVVKDQKKLIVRTPQQFKEMQDIDVLTEHRVTKIDPRAKKIEVVDLSKSETQWVSYDKLIIATGARSRRLNIPGNNASNLFTLKDLQDGIRIRNYIDEKRPKRVSVLGGGFIGLEMCEAFRLRGLETYLFCRRDLPAGNLEREISEKILKELEENGVYFQAYHEPVAFNLNSNNEIKSVETNKGNFPTDMVLMAIGVIPNVEIAREAGIEIGKTGAIRTDFYQRTNIEDIYTAGDCSEVFNLVSQDWVHTPLGDIANKQGRVAGENAAGGNATFHGVVGSAAFKVFELEVAFTGLGTQVAKRYGFDVDSQVIEAESKVGYMPGSKRMLIKLIFDRRDGRLLGAQMAGKEGVARRINVLAVALHQKMTIDEISRLDFAYAPPFSAPLDPILIAAEQAVKKLKG